MASSEGDRSGVLVVGAAGGIGRAICGDLASRGYSLALADIDGDGVVSLQDSLQNTGDGRVAAFAVDMTERPAIEDLLHRTVDHVGRLDAVVNLVGLNVFGNLEDLTDEEWDRVAAVNLKLPFMLSCESVKAMRKSGCRSGSLIHFVSGTAQFGSPGQGAYAAFKAGLTNLIKTMALEWATSGVRVNGVSPIMTETAINRDWLNEEPDRKARIAARIPLARLGEPTDYIGIVRLLLSHEGRFITGQTLTVDGGTTVQHPLLK